MSRVVVCDLDGVVYLGSEPIPGAGEALGRLEADGAELVFCTNNSTRTRQATATKITRLTGHPVRPDQVVSSATAAASLLAGSTSRALVVGGEGIVEALEAVGVERTDRPDDADAVVVGLDRGITYERLAAASSAIRRGARFIATNHDPTFPTPDGLLPGAGAIVAAVEAASATAPEIAGKPHPPIRRLISGRIGGREVWLVGDRPDTDLAMAAAEGWRSILVLSGVVSGAAGAEPQPDLVAASIADVPDLVVSADGG